MDSWTNARELEGDTMRAAPSWLATDMGLPGGDGTVGSPEGGLRDATRALGRVLGLCVVGVRGGAGLLGGILALVGMAPPVSVEWLVPVVAVNFAWTAVFVRTSAKRGLLTWVMSVDVAFVVTLCIFQSHYVSWEALPGGASWVATIASMCVISGHLAWRPVIAVPTGAIVTAAYVIGEIIAGSPNGGIPQAAVQTLQNVSTMGLMMLVRTVSNTADTELHEYYRATRKARAQQAQRSEERETNRRLHDTVLATLTTVGSGAIQQSSAKLRAHARTDLDVIAALTNGLSIATGQVRLDQLLRQIAQRTGFPLRVKLALVSCEVPDAVAESFAWAATEALTNVGRHAGVDEAALDLTTDDHTITVRVTDRGKGFDPESVPTHRYGLREAVAGRMAEHGGTASIESAPGAGTRITLSWSADE